MDPPPVQYATTSDGMRIAFGVSGSGAPLLFLPGIFYHVQLAWQYPGLQSWLAGLAERFHLIQLDPRGTGMSSRDVSDGLARRDYSRDIDAVVASLGLDRFVIFAASNGVDLAVHYALQNEARVSALVLGTSGTARADSALFAMLPSEDWDAFLHSVVPRDRTREEADKLVALTRQASDQRNYLLRRRALGNAGELEEMLARVRSPTLVMHSRGYAFTPIEEGMKKAQLIPGARLVLIDGTDPWGVAEQGIRAIETFLSGLVTHEVAITGGQGLSSREMEVLRLIGAGRSNQQIAEELVISINTVARHVSNIFTKIDAANRAEAAVYAQRAGLL
jgi:pimeloyl-ACP methyl ester carboxylesterase/DNA-binding CsgD family transcriptional regulator